jgi:hypothetical protein
MKYFFALLFLLLFGYGEAQQINKFHTPWYGMIGFHTNSSKYSSGGNTIKAPLTYFDVRAVFLGKNGFMEFGIPVTGYLLTGVIAKGNLPDDNGEVPFLYAKGGFDLMKNKYFRIGLGASFNGMLINVDGIEGYGASLESYGTISPLIYAKISLGPFLVAPVFEYNVVSWTNTNGTKRPGYSIGSHIVVPIGKRLGLNINPMYEKGTFKSDQSEMSSTNFSFKVGLMIRP